MMFENPIFKTGETVYFFNIDKKTIEKDTIKSHYVLKTGIHLQTYYYCYDLKNNQLFLKESELFKSFDDCKKSLLHKEIKYILNQIN